MIQWTPIGNTSPERINMMKKREGCLKFSILKISMKPQVPTPIIPIHFFFFISNNSLLIKKEKFQVHWWCTWVTIHQSLKLQRSKNLKNLNREMIKSNTPIQKRVKKKRFNLVDRPFIYLRASHIPFLPKTPTLQKTIFQCLPKGPCQVENKSVTLCGITHRRAKKFHTMSIAQKLWDNEVKDVLPTLHSFCT